MSVTNYPANMQPQKLSGQPGSSSQQPIVIDEQSVKEETQPKEGIPSAMPPEYASEQPTHSSPDPDTVDTVYKIVWSDRPEYPLNGKLYIRYNVLPEIHRTVVYCISAFHFQDVRAAFECVYYPSIQLFDNFKPFEGTLRGGSRGVQSVQVSMWYFADRGPYHHPKHTVKDENGNRIMTAVMIMPDQSIVRLHGKMVREGENEDGVWLSGDERRALRLQS